MTRYLVLVLMLMAAPAFAEAPEWVLGEGRSAAYPTDAYFTGFAVAMLGSDSEAARCAQVASDNARRSLIQGIQVTVKAVTFSQTEDVGGKLSSYASAVTESASSLDLKGLRQERHADTRMKVCYALAVVKKGDLARDCAAKAEMLKAQMAGHAAAGKRYEEKSDRTRALGEFLCAQNLLVQYHDAQGLLEFAARGSATNFADLAAEKVGEGQPSSVDIKAAIERLVQKPVQGLPDAAWLLAFYLKEQSGLADAKLLVQPFTFRDTRMSSAFARYFKQLLETQLVGTAKWAVVEPRMDTGKDASGAGYALVGSYWPQDGGLRLLVKLRRTSDGGVAAATELLVPAPALQAAKLDIQPENYRKALSEQGVFAEGELKGGGLTLELWTNKGADSLVFARGEKMKAFVRLNLPAYVRILYHLADGKRALLLDNYFIDAGKVNLAYELPQEFECDAPFGVERLQAFASTKPFEPLKTRSVDGYDILGEDLDQALRTTRGMKKVQGGSLKAEARVDLTTMER